MRIVHWQVAVVRGSGGMLATFLPQPGELRALSLACELSMGLPQLLAGLTGLERLALPGMALDSAEDAVGPAGRPLDCLAALTRLSGAAAWTLLAFRYRVRLCQGALRCIQVSKR